MFLEQNWQCVDKPENAHMIQFTGGQDINPALYAETKHATTNFNTARDNSEMEIWDKALKTGKAMTGICRGGQLIHVLAGGFLIQHANNHNTHPHEAFYQRLEVKKKIVVSSTHHQMMADPNCGQIIMQTPHLSTIKEGHRNNKIHSYKNKTTDIEAMLYPDLNALSFQPHPEYAILDTLFNDCYAAYFFFLNKALDF